MKNASVVTQIITYEVIMKEGVAIKIGVNKEI